MEGWRGASSQYSVCDQIHGVRLPAWRRDIKPHNLLVDFNTHALVLCTLLTPPSPFSSLHSLSCGRDIKPQNLLVNINSHALKLCDFGSAKALVRGEPNISYICSRYYRAPELIFGATDYTCAIDVSSLAGWS